MIRRNKAPKRTTTIRKRRTVERRGPAGIPANEWRNRAYREWLYDKPCAACGDRRGSDPAHSEHNGMSSKGRDSSCLPLCRYHHLEQHALGTATFQTRYDLDMREAAKLWWERFSA